MEVYAGLDRFAGACRLGGQNEACLSMGSVGCDARKAKQDRNHKVQPQSHKFIMLQVQPDYKFALHPFGRQPQETELDLRPPGTIKSVGYHESAGIPRISKGFARFGEWLRVSRSVWSAVSPAAFARLATSIANPPLSQYSAARVSRGYSYAMRLVPNRR